LPRGAEVTCAICHDATPAIGRICDECEKVWERRGLLNGHFAIHCNACGERDTVGIQLDLRDEGRCAACLTLHRIDFARFPEGGGFEVHAVPEPPTTWVLDGPATAALHRLMGAADPLALALRRGAKVQP
jgi:hypothetical protein